MVALPSSVSALPSTHINIKPSALKFRLEVNIWVDLA